MMRARFHLSGNRSSVDGMKLYSGPLSMFGAKAEIALSEKAVDFELVMAPFENRASPSA